MEIKGKLHSIGEVKQFQSGFMVQEFYLDLTRFNQDTGEKYENWGKFQNTNERINLDEFNIGDMVKIKFSVRGNKYSKQDGSTGFAQNLNAYNIELVKPASEMPEVEKDEKEDDLPF